MADGKRSKDPAILFGDNVAVDTHAAALVASDPARRFDLRAVVNIGRPITRDLSAPRDVCDDDISAEYARLDAQRLVGFLHRAGREIPGFVGGIAPIHVVPRARHIDTRNLMMPGDEKMPVGGFDDLVRLIEGLESPVHIISAGPFTGLPQLLNHPTIGHKFSGIMVGQHGLFDWQDSKVKDPVTGQMQPGTGKIGARPFAGKTNSFNLACDPGAANQTLTTFRGPTYLLPTDITRLPDLEFTGADELAQLGFYGELVETYRKAYAEYRRKQEETAGPPRPGEILMHDAQLPGLLDHAIQQRDAQRAHGTAEVWYGPHGVIPVSLAHIPHTPEERDRWGSVDIDENPGRDTGFYMVRYHAGSPRKPARKIHRSLLLKSLSQKRVEGTRPPTKSNSPSGGTSGPSRNIPTNQGTGYTPSGPPTPPKKHQPPSSATPNS